jgi:hypothetical protein
MVNFTPVAAFNPCANILCFPERAATQLEEAYLLTFNSTLDRNNSSFEYATSTPFLRLAFSSQCIDIILRILNVF